MINNDFIVIGDTHFFDKNFNLDYFNNQMNFYENQLIPYMVKNNISDILQMGDLFDNRSTINIHLFNLFTDRFCSLLEKNNIRLISFLGNHDIVFKNTLEYNMVKYLEKLYPLTFKIIQEQSIININSKKVGVIPWLINSTPIDPMILETTEYIFGHFELNGFNHSKYVVDNKSELNQSVFKNQKKVFSGHYHLNHSKGKVHYIGTPYQSDFGEFGNNSGFYHFNKDFTYHYHKNTESNIYVKFQYDENNEIPLRVFFDDEIYKDITLEELKGLTKIEAKFLVLYSKDALYEEYLLVLKENNIKFQLTNNQEIQELVQESTDCTNMKSTEHFILDYIKEYHFDLFDLSHSILKEIGN